MSLWPIFLHWLHQTLPLWEYVRNVDLVSAKQKDRYVVASVTVCRANLSTDVPCMNGNNILLWSGISAILIQCGFKGVSNKANHLQWMGLDLNLSQQFGTYVGRWKGYYIPFRCSKNTYLSRSHVWCIVSVPSRSPWVWFSNHVSQFVSHNYMFTYYLCTALPCIYCSFIYFLTNGLIHLFMCIFYNLAIVSKWEESIGTDSMLKWCLRTWSKGQDITLEIQTWQPGFNHQKQHE